MKNFETKKAVILDVEEFNSIIYPHTNAYLMADYETWGFDYDDDNCDFETAFCNICKVLSEELKMEVDEVLCDTMNDKAIVLGK